MRWLHTGVIAVLGLALLVFAFQNLQSVTVAFLGFGMTVPLAILAIVIYLLGMATGSSIWSLVRWAWHGSQQPKAVVHK